MENKMKRTLLGVLAGATIAANAYAGSMSLDNIVQKLGVTSLTEIKIENVGRVYYAKREDSPAIESIAQLYAGYADVYTKTGKDGTTTVRYITSEKAVEDIGERYYNNMQKSLKKAYGMADKDKDRIVTTEEINELSLKIYNQYSIKNAEETK